LLTAIFACFGMCAHAEGKANASEAERHAMEAAAKAQVELVRDSVNVSILRLLANPKEFGGRLINVSGFFHQDSKGREQTAGIYLHRDDYVYGLRQNGLLVELKPGSGAKSGYVRIVGTFDSDDHEGMWGGKIKDVRMVLPITPEEEP
jgi:hypothetical protein